MGIGWNFPSNNFGQLNGISEAGIETFRGSPYSSLAREICQNSLDAILDKDKPEFVFHIECSQTSYRTILKTSQTENVKRIPESKLNGRVSVCTFINSAQENLRCLSRRMNCAFNF
ncbi:hypothetical protein [Crassaminicella indica]|uniref:Uncharacterized protein n=1 Tax=Crassaminicella indica TaxID=2855394 RepID=A0ABX8RD87_9CLOT|nr:hypothetical protein [Crassaminicella indica]QXM06731.1 hypothetical protein KVH43_03140 [Crassaminicella indica]